MRSLKLNILMALVTLIWAGCAAGQGYKLVDIEEFVRQRFIHGVPFRGGESVRCLRGAHLA